MTKKTPLYHLHEKYNGKMVDFFGYYLPIQYEKGILYEHQNVRNHVGLFDVSHMGEFFFEGEHATEAMLRLFTVDVRKQKDHTVRYGFLCDHQGHTIDDCLVYKYSDTKYLVVVNGANIIKNEAWIKEQLEAVSCFDNRSDDIALIAIQGPDSLKLCERANVQLPQKYYTFVEKTDFFGFPVMISKTGYTGELGFEVDCDPKDAPEIWEKLLVAGEDLHVACCGLGCRDTLRLEAGMPLYGHELSGSIAPIDSSLGMFLSADHQAYIGANAHKRKPKTKRIGLQLLDKGVPREGYALYQDDRHIGNVSSGTFSPSMNVGIAMALVDVDVDETKPIEVELRNKKIQAKVVSLPFAYKHQGGK